MTTNELPDTPAAPGEVRPRATRAPRVEVTPPTGWDSATIRGLAAILREDWATNGNSPFVPGTVAITVLRLGQWLDDPHRAGLVRRVGLLFYRAAASFTRAVLGFDMRKETKVGRRVEFAHQHGVVIDPGAEIGDEVLVLHGVTIGLRLTTQEGGLHRSGAKIGRGVTLGAGAKIIGNVRIGDGATVGPNAVVTTDVPAHASVVAAPSRVLRIRLDNS